MKNIFRNLSPFSNETDMPAFLYAVKKVLAFILVYFLSAVIGEAVIIAILMCMGYDPINGVMPKGQIASLLQYYGFAIFSLMALLYCKIIEKRKTASFKIGKAALDYVTGLVIAVVVLLMVLIVCMITGAISFEGVNKSAFNSGLLLYLLAFIVQGSAEEIMCRYFLMNSLSKKMSLTVSVFLSSTAFVIPHLSSILESDAKYAIVGVVNLYLVSFCFSLLAIFRKSVLISCGLHSAWNFLVYAVLGLTLSGSNSGAQGVVEFCIKRPDIINGGEYGIEAGVATMLVHILLLVVLAALLRRREKSHGIQ